MTAVSTVGGLIEALIDYRGKTPPKSVSGVPLITAKVIKGGKILAEPREFISEDSYDAWMRRGLPESGDILITTEAPLGELARVGDDARIALAQRVILLRPDARLVDPSFMFHYLRSPQAQAALGRRASGTTVSGIRQPELRSVEIPLPDRSSQRAVGGFLDALDELIENARRRVELLEVMAQTIYCEWFVKFRYPGYEDVPLVDSALGPIPEGWEHANLYDAADVGFGFSFKAPQFAAEGPHQVIRIRDIPVGISSTFTDEAADPRYAVHDDDVLIGMDGDFHMTVWTGGDAWLNQRVTRLRPRRDMSPLHLLMAIERQIIEWNRAIVGTTVAHLGKKHLELVTVLVPDSTTLERATEIFGSLMDQRRCLEQSSRRLANLRDLLLPKLVTGQIDVSKLDLGALVSEASA